MPNIVVIEVDFNIDDSEKTTIKTNAKRSTVKEILEAWLSCQMGQGEDESEPNMRDSYKITIRLNLNDDTFSTSSDTGNKGFTCGIIMDILGRLSQIKVSSLS